MKDPLETDARVELQKIKDNFDKVIRKFVDDNISKSDHVFDLLDHLRQLDGLMMVLCAQHESDFGLGDGPMSDPIEVDGPGR